MPTCLTISLHANPTNGHPGFHSHLQSRAIVLPSSGQTPYIYIEKQAHICLSRVIDLDLLHMRTGRDRLHQSPRIGTNVSSISLKSKRFHPPALCPIRAKAQVPMLFHVSGLIINYNCSTSIDVTVDPLCARISHP